MMRRWMRRNGHGLIVMNLSITYSGNGFGGKYWLLSWRRLSSAIGIYGWKKGIFLPDWIVWQEKRQTVEEKGGEIFLEQRSLTLKRTESQAGDRRRRFSCRIFCGAISIMIKKKTDFVVLENRKIWRCKAILGRKG